MAGTAPAAMTGKKRKRPPTFSHLPVNRGTAVPLALHPSQVPDICYYSQEAEAVMGRSAEN